MLKIKPKIMGLKVIGAGLGRTGTETLKLALEHLGYDKCYHMYELMKNPAQLIHWEELREGGSTNLSKLFHGYQASVDFPAAIYYREFLDEYPDAKVILTVRDADKWYESASHTIFRKIPAIITGIMRILAIFSAKYKAMLRALKYAREIVHDSFFQGKTHDGEACKRIYHEWNLKVQQSVPPDKLLVFEVKDGWEPLCRFLEVPVPDAPFPRSNSRENFTKELSKKMKSS